MKSSRRESELDLHRIEQIFERRLLFGFDAVKVASSADVMVESRNKPPKSGVDNLCR